MRKFFCFQTFLTISLAFDCTIDPIVFQLKNRPYPRSQQVDPTKSNPQVQSNSIEVGNSILLWILTNRSCKVDPVKSILTVSILQKRSNLIIHVAIYNFCGLCLPNPLNQKWSRNFNNYRNACECFNSLRICIFHKIFPNTMLDDLMVEFFF